MRSVQHTIEERPVQLVRITNPFKEYSSRSHHYAMSNRDKERLYEVQVLDYGGP